MVVQKLTELGVDVIVPFVAERSVVVWDRRKAEAARVRFDRVARVGVFAQVDGGRQAEGESEHHGPEDNVRRAGHQLPDPERFGAGDEGLPARLQEELGR